MRISADMGVTLMFNVDSGLGRFFSSANGLTSSGTESGGGITTAEAFGDVAVALAGAGVDEAAVGDGWGALVTGGGVKFMVIGGNGEELPSCAKPKLENMLLKTRPSNGKNILMLRGRMKPGLILKHLAPGASHSI